MKRITALAHMLSQKHLAEAEENHRLELTASAAILHDPRAGTIKNTINKPFNATSNPLQGKSSAVTGSNSNLSPALTATAQPPSKKARVARPRSGLGFNQRFRFGFLGFGGKFGSGWVAGPKPLVQVGLQDPNHWFRLHF
jgi:hypothetical protein